LDTRVVRLGPVYGPFERPTGSRRTMSAVHIALELALAGQPLRCLAPQHSRDWIHGRDAARAMIALLRSATLSHGVYNLGGEAIAMERLLRAVAAAVPGSTVEWVDRPEAANVPSNRDPDAFRNMDTGRLRRDVGFQQSIGIDEGIRETADWLRADRMAGQ
jgi:UDP-glucose 4-epimerase/UDP-glucuronate 4-epimerase